MRMILSGGVAGGRVAAQAKLLKENPKAVAIVKDEKALNILVKMGVDPSQIIRADLMKKDDERLMKFMRGEL